MSFQYSNKAGNLVVIPHLQLGMLRFEEDT